MVILDDDLEFAKEMRTNKKNHKDKDFSKLINKKDLNRFEMDDMFIEE